MKSGGAQTVGGLRKASIGLPLNPSIPFPVSLEPPGSYPAVRGEGDAPSLPLFKAVFSQRFLSSMRICLATDFRVSNTPTPVVAMASKVGSRL